MSTLDTTLITGSDDDEADDGKDDDAKDDPVSLPRAQQETDVLPQQTFQTGVSTALHFAAQNTGDHAAQMCEVLLQEKADPKSKDMYSNTALHYAVLNTGDQAAEICEVLLNGNADPNARALHGASPLHIAAINTGDHAAEILETLLHRNADSNIKTEDNLTALHLAALHSTKICKVLLDWNADPSIKDKYGVVALHLAAENTGHNAVDICETLLQREVGPDVKDNDNLTALHIAAKNTGDHAADICRVLLKWKADPNLKDIYSSTALHYATQSLGKQAAEICEVLLNGNADPNARPSHGFTPLHTAALNNGDHAAEICEVLLKRNTNSNTKTTDNLTALHLAALHSAKICKVLLDWNADPNIKDIHGVVALHNAAQNIGDNAIDICEMLLQRKVDPNIKDRNGSTALHFAAKNTGKHPVGICKILLKEKVDPNITDLDGFSALHLAASNTGNHAPEICRVLLTGNASPNITNKDGSTALHCAAKNTSRHAVNICSVLLKWKVDPNIKNSDNLTALHHVASGRSGHNAVEICKLLLKWKADPNITIETIDNLTALHLAALHSGSNAAELVKVLLEWNADPNIKDKDCKTAFDYAETNRKGEQVRILLAKYKRRSKAEEASVKHPGPAGSAGPTVQQATNISPVKMSITPYRDTVSTSNNTEIGVGTRNEPAILPSLPNVLVDSIRELQTPHPNNQRSLATSGPMCGWECVPLAICQRFYPLLDDIDPLGRDYRALADALGVTELIVSQIQAFQPRNPSMTASILAYVCRCRIYQGKRLSIQEVIAIVKHPGIVGNEAAANILEDMLTSIGHPVPSIRHALQCELPPEVLLRRAILARSRDVLRNYVTPGDLTPSLVDVLSQDDISDILKCEDNKTFNRSKAVDLLLVKLMHLRDTNWYAAFLEGINSLGQDLLPAVLGEAEKSLLQHPAFAVDGNSTIREIQEDVNEDRCQDYKTEESSLAERSPSSHKDNSNTYEEPSQLGNLAKGIRPKWRQIAKKLGFDRLKCDKFQGLGDPDDWRPALYMLKAWNSLNTPEDIRKNSLINALTEIGMDNLVKDVHEL